MKHKDTFEDLPKRLKIEQNIAQVGAYVLAVSANIAAVSPKYAEYPAMTGGGIFLAGVIATAIDIYKLRASYSHPPDNDPEREDIDTLGEIVELRQYKGVPLPQEKAA